MSFSKKTTFVALWIFAFILTLPKNLFAATADPNKNSTTSKSSTSSTASSSTSAAAAPAGGGSGSHENAKTGTMIGGVLIGVGAIHVAIGRSTCPECNWYYIIGGIAEMAGGLIAMTQNSKAAKDTAPKGMNFDGLTTGGAGTAGNIPNLPNGMPKLDVEKCTPPVCNCNDAVCSQPQINLPSKEDLESLMRTGTMPDGTSLEDALSKLNENYDKAKAAAAEFNKLSAAGAFDPSGSGIENLDISALTSDSTESDSSDNLGGGGGSGSGGSSSGSTKTSRSDDDSDDFKTEPMIDFLAKQRGEQAKAFLVGMNSIDAKSGKVLTIFERMTRTLRGKNNRDLVLAKNEWIRKKALKNKKNSVKLK
jgi:hypothetical protein